MSHSFYNVLHIFGILLLFVALGGRAMQGVLGGTDRARMLVGASHGLGLFLVLLAGFGMLARLGILWPWPGWVWVKVVIWLVLGALLIVPKRAPKLATPLWVALPFLGALAAWSAIYKPF